MCKTKIAIISLSLLSGLLFKETPVFAQVKDSSPAPTKGGTSIGGGSNSASRDLLTMMHGSVIEQLEEGQEQAFTSAKSNQFLDARNHLVSGIQRALEIVDPEFTDQSFLKKSLIWGTTLTTVLADHENQPDSSETLQSRDARDQYKYSVLLKYYNFVFQSVIPFEDGCWHDEKRNRRTVPLFFKEGSSLIKAHLSWLKSEFFFYADSKKGITLRTEVDLYFKIAAVHLKAMSDELLQENSALKSPRNIRIGQKLLRLSERLTLHSTGHKAPFNGSSIEAASQVFNQLSEIIELIERYENNKFESIDPTQEVVK